MFDDHDEFERPEWQPRRLRLASVPRRSLWEEAGRDRVRRGSAWERRAQARAGHGRLTAAVPAVPGRRPTRFGQSS